MGCILAPAGNNTDKKTNQKIEKELRADKKQRETLIKMLLLGAGESGKTTFAKQIKILFLNGYSNQELLSYKDIIHSNCLMGMRTLVLEAKSRNISLGKKLKDSVELITSEDVLLDQRLDKDIAQAIATLWKSSKIQDLYNQRSEFQLTDSVGFYFKDIMRIADESYVPNVDDILQARARTIGIKEITFQSKGYNWRIVDVGGQRNERKKWIHCFEDVTAIIFFTDASAYNMTLFEDDRVNRLLEALTLFEEICNCKYFDSTPLILFLNKSDLLGENLKHHQIKDYFPDYKGANDFDTAISWMKKEFSKLNKNPDKPIYIHVTCATSTDNIRFVFTAVEEIILYETLMDNYLI